MSKNLPVMQAKAAIDKAFPGSPSPAVVVIEAKDVTTPAGHAGDRELRAEGRRERARVQALHAQRLAGSLGRAAVRAHQGRRPQRPGRGLDEGAAHSVVPQTLNSSAGITAQVAGEAAGTEDFNQVMRDRAPLVIGFVLLLSFLLLLVTFRSLIVPIKAIVLNLLSVGAAYGILVAVFQHSWAQGLLGFKSDGAIESWLPIFLFVVLFGLSMDYHVFILSRVRELWERGVPTEQAVEQGITETAGVVTSAAIVMVAVFAIFATPLGPRHEAARRRARDGDPAGRDARARRAPAGHDEAPRRPQLVPAEEAQLAAARQPRHARAGLLSARALRRPNEPVAPPRRRGHGRLQIAANRGRWFDVESSSMTTTNDDRCSCATR